MGFVVEDVEALVQLRRAVAPEPDPLSIGEIVEMVAHAEIGGSRRLAPEDVEIFVVAFERARERRVVSRLSVHDRLYGDACRDRVDRSLPADPRFGLVLVRAAESLAGLRRGEIEHK